MAWRAARAGGCGAAGLQAVGADHGAVVDFWAAALGGYGIQTAPAFGRLCAALVCGQAAPADIAAQGLQVDRLRPGRG